jgi:hypothetical protein
MTITPSYVGEPECNGVIERFMRTLKEQCLYLHRFQSLPEHLQRPSKQRLHLRPGLVAQVVEVMERTQISIRTQARDTEGISLDRLVTAEQQRRRRSTRPEQSITVIATELWMLSGRISTGSISPTSIRRFSIWKCNNEAVPGTDARAWRSYRRCCCEQMK